MTEKTIDVTFTAEIQRDGRIQIPGTIRRKLDLNRGDVLEITINKKL
jgi:AbrB family looped-hinge helix DNA binding protein